MRVPFGADAIELAALRLLAVPGSEADVDATLSATPGAPADASE
jgi:hypothetical protein